MHMRRLLSLAAGLALLAGCASSGKTPKYVTNFNQIRPGMTQGQVRALLGWPHLVTTYPQAQAHVEVPNSDDAWSGLKQDMNFVFSDGVLWQYGSYNLDDMGQTAELMDGSPKSFLVCFDPLGHVIRARRPVLGPYANTNQLSGGRPSATPTPAELWTGDAFGRDKANVGPTTQP